MKALSRWNTLTILLIAGFILVLSESTIAHPRRVVVHKPHRTIVYPKHGKVVRVLPAGHHRVVVGKHHYYYNAGVFYSVRGSEYIVVRAPRGAVVESLPEGYEVVHKHGKEYYFVNDTYFRPEIRRGAQVYVVVHL